MNKSNSFPCPECSSNLIVSGRVPVGISCCECGTKLSLISKGHLEKYLPSFLFKMDGVTISIIAAVLLTSFAILLFDTTVDGLSTMYLLSCFFFFLIIYPIYDSLLTEKKLVRRENIDKKHLEVCQNLLEDYIPDYVIETVNVIAFFLGGIIFMMLGIHFLNRMYLAPSHYLTVLLFSLFLYAFFIPWIYRRLLVRKMPLASTEEQEAFNEEPAGTLLAMQALEPKSIEFTFPDDDPLEKESHSLLVRAIIISMIVLSSCFLSVTYLRPIAKSLEMKVDCSALSTLQIDKLHKETRMTCID